MNELGEGGKGIEVKQWLENLLFYIQKTKQITKKEMNNCGIVRLISGAYKKVAFNPAPIKYDMDKGNYYECNTNREVDRFEQFLI